LRLLDKRKAIAKMTTMPISPVNLSIFLGIN
jgi:hypothetical protein